jgi:hypothetical protein
MTSQGRDRLTGTILLVFAGLWCWGVLTMIPNVGHGTVGPRGFPFGLGILLAALSALLIVSTFFKSTTVPSGGDGEEPSAQQGNPLLVEVWAVGSTVALLAGYAYLMTATGFLIATVVAVAAALLIIVGKRSLALVGGLSLGTALVAYVIFAKILNVYLPRGRWVDIWF